MPMRITMDLPDDLLPRWATDLGATSEPTSGEKDTGGVVNTKPPARKINWLFNRLSEWMKYAVVNNVACFIRGDDFQSSAGEWTDVIYHPELYRWVAVATVDGHVDYSLTPSGRDWGASVSGAVVTDSIGHCLGIDSQYFLCGNNQGTIHYGNGGAGGWAGSDAGPFGLHGAEYIESVVTKYPDSDFVMCGSENGNVSIAAGGITTGWVAPSTPPPGLGAWNIIRIFRMGSTSWFLVASDRAAPNAIKTYYSLDDGDVWIATTTQPAIHADFDFVLDAAYSWDTGTIVLVGERDVATKSGIIISRDGGVTWTIPDSDAIGFLKGVNYCGNGIWIAVGETYTLTPAATKQLIYISFDDAETWQHVGAPWEINAAIESTDDLNAVACSNRRSLLIGDSDINATSLGIHGGSIG